MKKQYIIFLLNDVFLRSSKKKKYDIGSTLVTKSANIALFITNPAGDVILNLAYISVFFSLFILYVNLSPNVSRTSFDISIFMNEFSGIIIDICNIFDLESKNNNTSE